MNQEQRFQEAARANADLTERYFWPVAGLATCSLAALFFFMVGMNGKSRVSTKGEIEGLKAQIKQLSKESADLRARLELAEAERDLAASSARRQVQAVKPVAPPRDEYQAITESLALGTPAETTETEPAARVEPKPNTSSLNSGGWPTSPATKPATATPTHVAPSTYAPTTPSREPSASAPYGMGTYGPRGPPAINGVGENGSRYGDTSTVNGKPKTTYVQGYYRKDGTYVRGHYRSK